MPARGRPGLLYGATTTHRETHLRAQILESEGAKQSLINQAEGEKAEVILKSEAARTDAVNRATGEHQSRAQRASQTPHCVARKNLHNVLSRCAPCLTRQTACAIFSTCISIIVSWQGQGRSRHGADAPGVQVRRRPSTGARTRRPRGSTWYLRPSRRAVAHRHGPHPSLEVFIAESFEGRMDAWAVAPGFTSPTGGSL